MKRLLPLTIGALLLAGCATSSAQHRHPLGSSLVDRPPSVALGELMRRERVIHRAKEWVRSGQYPNRREAIKVAERENPPVADPAFSAWSRHHTQALRRKTAQDRFERELAALRQK